MKRYLALMLVGLFLLSLVPGAFAQNADDRTTNELNTNLQYVQQSQNNNDDSQLWNQNQNCLTVNQQVYQFGDNEPIIIDGQLLIPIRALSAALGADVDWDQDNKTATISVNGVVLEITINEEKIVAYLLEGEERENIEIDKIIQNTNGRIIVPVREIAEALNYDVGYDAATHTVSINTREKGTLVQGRDQQRFQDESCLTPTVTDTQDDSFTNSAVTGSQDDSITSQDAQKRLRDGSCL